MKSDHRSKFSNLSNWKEEAWKNQNFNRIRTRDLRDTGAMSTNWAMKPHIGSEVKHFTNIAQVLAQEVPAAEVNPEVYLSYIDKAFCLKISSLDVQVFNLLGKIDEKKATGLDMIASKLLKMAASIVALSLTAIFTKLSLGFIQQNGNGQGNSGV